MKKIVSLLALLIALTFGLSSILHGQEDKTEDTDTTTASESVETTEDQNQEEVVEESAIEEEVIVDDVERSFTQVVKDKFIEGDWRFMSPVLLCLILGLAVAIERIIVLNLGVVNSTKLLKSVDNAIESEGVEEALKVCKATRGPIASIFYQGLSRVSEGVEVVEKSIISYGSVQMGRLESGLVWISLFISLAPMLGFMGTVIGMIGAFDAIEAAGDISPSLVAGGIKIALLTTVAGLIVAIILQLFYNYCVSRIDGIVNQMEDASISLVDIVVKHSDKLLK